MIELTGIEDESIFIRADQVMLIRRYHDKGVDGSRIDSINGVYTFWVKETPKQVATKVDNVHG